MVSAQRTYKWDDNSITLPSDWRVETSDDNSFRAYSLRNREIAIYIESQGYFPYGKSLDGQLTKMLDRAYREKRGDRSLGFRLEKRYPLGSTRLIGGHSACALAYTERSPRTGERNRLTKYFCVGRKGLSECTIVTVTIVAPASQWEDEADELHAIVDSIVWWVHEI